MNIRPKVRDREAARRAANVDGDVTRWWNDNAIDERITQLCVECEPLKDAVGHVMGRIGREVRDELTRVIEEQQRSFEAKLAEQEKRFLASNADGAQGQAQLRVEIKNAITETVDAFGAQLTEQREKLREEFRVGVGRLPIAKTWDPDEVSYRGDVVICDGSVFQALKDTGKPPAADHSDWILLARAGRDGLMPNIRGAFNVYKKYAQLDVVEYEDASYIARRDAPGLCPGDGWQILSRSGRRGPAGERGPQGRKGERGAPGEAAPTIASWTLDQKNYRAIPTLSNGTQGAVLELRGLFEQFVVEVGYAAGS